MLDFYHASEHLWGYHPTPKLIAAVEKAIVKQLHRKFIGHVFAEVMRHTPPPKPEPVE